MHIIIIQPNAWRNDRILYHKTKEASTVVKYLGSDRALKKWRKILDFVSCFPLHFFLALLLSTVHYNRTKHSRGFFRVSWKQRPLRPPKTLKTPKTLKLENKDPPYFAGGWGGVRNYNQPVVNATRILSVESRYEIYSWLFLKLFHEPSRNAFNT